MSYNPIHTKQELEQIKKQQGNQTPPVPPNHTGSHSPIHTKQELEQIKHEQERHKPTPPAPSQPEVNISDAEYIAFIGPNDDDYLPAFKEFHVNGSDKFVRTWNWGAFIGGPWWFLYRKMHVWAAIYFVLALPFFVFIPFLGLIPMAGLGMTGNYVYYRYAKKKIEEVKLMHPVRDITPDLQAIGGIHKWGFFVGILGTIILFWAIWTVGMIITGLSILNGK